MIPDVIFLQWYDDDGEHDKWVEVTWCQDRVHATDIAYRRLTSAEAEVARLRAALEAVEWANEPDDDRWGICPWCHRCKIDGHAINCQRQAALGVTP